MVVCSPTPEWKRSSEFDLNGKVVPDDDDEGFAAPPQVGLFFFYFFFMYVSVLFIMDSGGKLVKRSNEVEPALVKRCSGALRFYARFLLVNIFFSSDIFVVMSVPCYFTSENIFLQESHKTQFVMTNDDILGDIIPVDQQETLRQFCYQSLKLPGVVGIWMPFHSQIFHSNLFYLHT